MKVLLAVDDPRPERWVEAIVRRLAEAEVFMWNPEGDSVAADYAIVWQPPERLFERERHLKAIFNLGAGVDGLLRVRSLPRDVPVIRLEDAGMSAQMAEFVAYHVIECSRDMAAYRAQQSDGMWKVLRPIRREEWPVGVLGLGQIGSRVARTLAGLDYSTHGWARSKHRLDGVVTYAGAATFETFLREVRVLVNTLPLTPETRDILNYATLGRLRPDAVLINVGRGEHLVEDDLCRLIAEGRIRRAVLDVFREEPLPSGHRFWRMPEVTLTPHVAARTLREETVTQIVAKIRLIEAGQPISGVIDIRRGY
ncbi:MAG TPA: glyoxylate/hydroxypyruvate reductase A [Rhodocyclaceae bacterium]|nr:glyoxylate/hydroxypyruvate reductase A [Rhodocyclaceae bacterium]